MCFCCSSLDIVSIKDMERIKCFKTDLQSLGLAMCLQKVEINDAIYILAGFESGDIVLWDFVSGEVCSHLKLRECMTSLTFDTVTGKNNLMIKRYINIGILFNLLHFRKRCLREHF